MRSTFKWFTESCNSQCTMLVTLRCRLHLCSNQDINLETINTHTLQHTHTHTHQNTHTHTSLLPSSQENIQKKKKRESNMRSTFKWLVSFSSLFDPKQENMLATPKPIQTLNTLNATLPLDYPTLNNQTPAPTPTTQHTTQHATPNHRTTEPPNTPTPEKKGKNATAPQEGGQAAPPNRRQGKCSPTKNTAQRGSKQSSTNVLERGSHADTEIDVKVQPYVQPEMLKLCQREGVFALDQHGCSLARRDETTRCLFACSTRRDDTLSVTPNLKIEI